MNGTIKPSRKTGRRAAALFALVAVLLLAPAAWALGKLEQKPGTAGCVYPDRQRRCLPGRHRARRSV